MKNKVLQLGILVLAGIAFASNLYSQSASAPLRFAEVEDVNGEVKVKAAPDDNWKAASKGIRLTEKGEIKTGEGSTAVVALDENGQGGKVNMKPNTWMRIAEMNYTDASDKKTLLDLALGQVLVQAEKLKGESSFQVRTPTSTTSVRGTVFEVKVEEA